MKKYLTILLIIFLTNCGFKPMFKNIDTSKINIKKIEYFGKNELTYLVQKNLNLGNNQNQNGYILEISVVENSFSIAKNSSGITTQESYILTTKLIIYDKNYQNILSQDNFSSSARINVTNNPSSDEETKRIERENIIRNLSQKIKFKLLTFK